MPQAIGAVFFVQVDDDLGVALRGKPVAERLELRAQFDVVEDLAVVDDPERTVLVADRLIAAGQVNDAEPRAAQANPVIPVDAVSVRPAMPEHPQHPQQGIAFRRGPFGQVEDAYNAAHE